MSVRTRTPLTAAALVTGAVLLVPAVAAADPPALDDRPVSCSELLTRAATFPGYVPTDDGMVHVVSDGYVSFLMRQPECAPTGT
jgi:hypothetical protein